MAGTKRVKRPIQKSHHTGASGNLKQEWFLSPTGLPTKRNTMKSLRKTPSSRRECTSNLLRKFLRHQKLLLKTDPSCRKLSKNYTDWSKITSEYQKLIKSNGSTCSKRLRWQKRNLKLKKLLTVLSSKPRKSFLRRLTRTLLNFKMLLGNSKWLLKASSSKKKLWPTGRSLTTPIILQFPSALRVNLTNLFTQLSEIIILT